MRGMVGIMDIEQLGLLDGQFDFGDKRVAFATNDRGSDKLGGDEFSKMLDGPDDKLFFCITVSWIAVRKLHCVDSHSCHPDGSPDLRSNAPACLFPADTAKEAARILKLCGSSANPNSWLEAHAVTTKRVSKDPNLVTKAYFDTSSQQVSGYVSR